MLIKAKFIHLRHWKFSGIESMYCPCKGPEFSAQCPHHAAHNRLSPQIQGSYALFWIPWPPFLCLHTDTCIYMLFKNENLKYTAWIEIHHWPIMITTQYWLFSSLKEKPHTLATNPLLEEGSLVHPGHPTHKITTQKTLVFKSLIGPLSLTIYWLTLTS